MGGGLGRSTDVKRTPFIALQFRDFRLLWFGMIASQIAAQMQVVAINWHIYVLTHSAISLGLIGLSGFVPVLCLSLLGGVAADRISRKRLLVAGQSVFALASVALFLTTASHRISPPLILLVVAINAAVSTFNVPSGQSLIPALVPNEYFMNAVSLNTLVEQASTVIGPSIAGFGIAFLGIANVYLTVAAGFTVSVVTLLAIQIPEQTREQAVTVSLRSILEGIAFVRRSPLIYSTMLLDFFATFFSSATVLLPIFAAHVLNTGARGLGILYAAPSVGAIVAGVIVASHHNPRRQGPLLIGAILVYGLATIGFGLSHIFLISLGFLAFVGAGDVVSTIIRNTIRQLSTPDSLRGRMVSINMIFFTGGPQLGETEAGLLASAVGVPASVVIGGVGTIVATLVIAACVPLLRRYQGVELAAG